MDGGGSKGTEFSQVPEREYSFFFFLPSFLREAVDESRWGVAVSGDIPLWRWGKLGHPEILGDPARIPFFLWGICSPNAGL